MRWKARWAVVPALVAVALLPVYLTTLAPGLTWANDGADGGDLVAAAATLGVAHPTGYPTYLLLARAFLTLPAGSPAYRANLLSAVSAALAAAVAAGLAARGFAGRRRLAWAGGAVAGLAFGLSPVLWSQAVIAEVYALHALFAGLALLAAAFGPAARPVSYRLAGLAFGVGLGNHLTLGLLLPPWLGAGAWRARRFQWRPLLERLLGLALGAGVYLYLPLRARAMPPVNWGDAATWQGFWWVVSGQPYRALAFGLPAENLLARVQAWAGLLIAQFGWLGLLAAFYGLFYGRAPASAKIVTGWTVAAFSLFAIGYGTRDSYAYLLPAFLALSVWLGVGVATALASLPGRLAGLEGPLICAFVLALLLNAGRHLPEIDASRDSAAEAFGRAVLVAAPPGALIFTQDDRDTFSLWYFHFATGERRDVSILVEPMLAFDWYRDNLRATYAGLAVPGATAGSWREALVALNPGRPQCETRLEGAQPLVCERDR